MKGFPPDRVLSRFRARLSAFGGREGCWVWTATRVGEEGYGRVSWSYGNKLFETSAHRLTYLISCGPIEEGFCVCHRCDNPACVNPAHLFLGTQLDNVADREAKGRGFSPRAEMYRQRTHCSKGHPYTPENTRLRVKGGRISRMCRTCRNAKELVRRGRDREGFNRRERERYHRRKAGGNSA